VAIENQLEQLIKEIRSLTKKIDKSSSTGDGPASYSSSTEAIDGQNESLEENIKKRREANAQLERSLEENKKQLKQLSDTTLGYQLLTKAVEEQEKELKEGTTAVEKQTAALNKLNEAQRAAAGFADDLAGAFGIVSAESTFFGKGIKALSKDGLPELNEQLKKSFKGANIAAGAFQKLFEATAGTGLSLFSDFQGSITSFNKQTGMMDGQMKRGIMDSAESVMKYGVTYQDASDALVSFTNANLMSNKSVRDAAPRLAATTALMTKFGVSAESTAANMEIMIRALNMGADEAIQAQEDIARLGIQIGIGAQAATTSFQQALPRLSLYGSDAVGIFENTARAASKMGMTVDQVLDIGERFQTFEGAAESAGRLNAILGGGFIDNLELMEASFDDPAEAALLLRDRIKDSGVTIRELGTMGIKAVGEQLGITDPAQVRKFLQGDLSGEDLMKAANDPVVTSLENLADNSQTLAEKQMSMMRDQLSALMPLERMDSSLRGILDSVGGFGLIFAHVGSQIISAIMMRGAISSAAGAASGGAGLLGRLGAGAAGGLAALGPVGLGVLAAGAVGLAGYGLYSAFSDDGPKAAPPAPRTQARQVTAATQRATQTTQRTMSSTQRMAAQTDSLIKETNNTLSDVRTLLSDIKSNTASTGKQVTSALKAG
tara:strand:- start:7970 stop:9955 length:1986 start_codon:yes stop_codon:yes gene_type:complete